jgi:hypothetical protein
MPTFHAARRLGALVLLATPLIAAALPYVPASDETIVQRLPTRIDAQTRAARRALAQAPDNLPLALQTAREAIARARRDGDPREYGNAEAALAPWWTQAAPPPAVTLLRATLRQSLHHFDDAIADLDRLLADTRAPLALRAQAELTRAEVLQVLGRYDGAQASCQRLAGPAYAAFGSRVQMTAQACLAELRSLQGDGTAAWTALAGLAASDGGAWLTLVRAELAERLGRDADAEALYRAAVAASPDVYPRAALSDWLLAHGRPADVLALLDAGVEDIDTLLLRRAIALQRLRDPRAAAAVAMLQARFDAARERGDLSLIHAREAALFELELRGDAAAALGYAAQEWSQQREPADALLLVRAARAAGRPLAAQPVHDFMRRTGYADARIALAESTK